MPERAKRRILIVDDDAVTVEQFARILRLEGYDTHTALTGDAALADASASPPDAVIVDLVMPGMDGLEFLRRLRLRPENRDTPAAVVTGDYFVDDHMHAQLRAVNAE